MEEKQIRKYLRRQFRPLGWSLVVYYLIMNAMVMLTMAVDSATLALKNLAYGRPGLPMEKVQDVLAQNAWGYLLTMPWGLPFCLPGRAGISSGKRCLQNRRKCTLAASAAFCAYFWAARWEYPYMPRCWKRC